MSNEIMFNGKQYADCIHVSTKDGKASFVTRLKWLFSNGKFRYSTDVYCENLPGNTQADRSCLWTASPSDWFPRKNVGMEAPMKEPEILEDGFIRFKGGY